MKKCHAVAFTICLLFAHLTLGAHCQMPCGIYHDDMIYDQIDQYVETMYKGMTVLGDSDFKTVHDKNEFVRWVMLKDRASDDVSQLLLTYFLQQKIKPDEANTADRLKSAHRLLFLAVQIKQNVDRALVTAFGNEWEKFKTMFHVEGYECQMELIKMRKQAEAQKTAESTPPVPSTKEHTHDPELPHDHTH